MTGELVVGSDGVLLCPACGERDTHVDIAYVSARHEDQDPNEIAVNAVTGRVVTHNPVPAPAAPGVGQGRRHRIALAGYCEVGGHRFAVVFTQHKGATLVETVTPIRHAADGDPQ
ncbi:hypothetical protein ABT344_24020 [Micromonospora carbonacea]|uniref:hypothetical protein n=1 Tax=Micromonospora carbonacea TaxID=47853 RepID=UPI00331B53DF